MVYLAIRFSNASSGSWYVATWLQVSRFVAAALPQKNKKIVLTSAFMMVSPAVLPKDMILVAPAKNESVPPNGPFPIHKKAKQRDNAERRPASMFTRTSLGGANVDCVFRADDTTTTEAR